RITWLYVHIVITGNDGVTNLQSIRRKNVTSLPIGIPQQRDPGGTSGIILDGLDFGRNLVLVALEIDEPIQTLIPATPMIARHANGVSAPPTVLKPLTQVFLRHSVDS